MKFPILLLAAASLSFAQDSQAPKKAISNIELTVYVVSGQAQSPAGAKDEVPQDLASVVQQFHGVFMYKSYKMIDQLELRSRNGGEAEIGGQISWQTGDGPLLMGEYHFQYKNAVVLPGQRTVHVTGLRLEITRRQLGLPAPSIVVLVATDIDVADGQKTVVGKTAVNGDAWFLVVVPKIIY